MSGSPTPPAQGGAPFSLETKLPRHGWLWVCRQKMGADSANKIGVHSTNIQRSRVTSESTQQCLLQRKYLCRQLKDQL